MSTESVDVSTFTAVGYRVIIIIRITIQYQIIFACHYIKTDSHAVMHRQMLINIITSAFITKTFGLGMTYDSHLRTYDFYISEMQIRATHIKHNDTLIFRFYP